MSSRIITDPQNLVIKAIWDGETVQDGNTKDMIFNLRQQISYLSQGTTLEAGTIFLTGTPAGIGYFRNPRVALNHVPRSVCKSTGLALLLIGSFMNDYMLIRLTMYGVIYIVSHVRYIHIFPYP